MTDFPDAPRVALEPREETTCSRCGTRCLDYRSPGPVCIGCVDEERSAAEAQVARLRGAVEDLAGCVRRYRDMYQRHGGDALDTGRAWDLMRRAEHAARAALFPAPVEERETPSPATRTGDCAACPHPGSAHLDFSGLCTADGCPCIEHEPRGGGDA